MFYLIMELVKKNRLSSLPQITLTNRNAFLGYPRFIRKIRICILAFVTFVIMVSFTFSNAVAILITWLLCIVVLIKQFTWLKKLKRWFQVTFHWDLLLLQFIVNNSLFSEKNVLESAVFSYEEKENEVTIFTFKYGDKFSSRLENLDIELSGLLNLSLTEKVIRAGVVEYHFLTEQPERLFVTAANDVTVGIQGSAINFGQGVIYDPVKCPHILISGGTGSGKSIFISFVLTELLKRKSKIYICDPKNSDLGSLSHYLGDEKVATIPNNIARVIRLAVIEMQERYDHMNKNFIYGSNFKDHGFNETWIIFDEMGAFQASGTDKKSKEVISEVLDGIKQIILLGRQSGVFCLISAQQMNANTLNTDLRDNLGLRIALGANSQEGYRMVFGSAVPKTIPKIEVKGAGLLYMQGSGKESAQYWESPYIDMENFDFIAELQKYI